MRLTFLLTAAAALAYWASVQFHDLLFAWSGHSAGVNWVFLPSGLRMLLVLLAPLPGALGIGVATLVEIVRVQPAAIWTESLVTSVISGGSPWIARWLCVRLGATDSALTQLSGTRLLWLSAVFALVSATLHQAWYVRLDEYASPLHAWPVMFVGDLIGSMLVLYAVRWLFHARNSHPDTPGR